VTAIVSFFGDLLLNVTERGRALVGLKRATPLSVAEILRLADDLMSNRGEASGVALARDILSGYAALSQEDRTRVLVGFAEGFGPPVERLKHAAQAFLAHPDARNAGLLFAASEPRRQELVRRLNLAPGGTHALVRMREDLLERRDANPALQAFDEDFVHLFSAWFNRGFLVLRQIDWSTPANILEKIIRYEAVHAIAGWDDLRRRLEPRDRRLFAFFHPALADEPLIFVQVALTESIPAAIQPLLKQQIGSAPARPTTAVFYSISNAQKGLAGISFGNFLIKQVVEDLKRETPSLSTFVTLSPVPGFARWLADERAKESSDALTADDRRALALLDHPNWTQKAGAVEAAERALLPLAAHYFLKAKTASGRPIDPVARFHLGNGARLERLNFLGDESARGLAQSHGLMVNYLYDLGYIEQNHEAFVAKGEIAASTAVRRPLRAKSVASDFLASLS
jgi:malonyl-CoA decarboxylase